MKTPLCSVIAELFKSGFGSGFVLEEKKRNFNKNRKLSTEKKD